MKVTVIMESIAIPEFPKNYVTELPEGSTVSDLAAVLEQDGLLGALSCDMFLSSHAFICNSEHIKKEVILHDGDHLMIIKTLIGG